MSSFFIFFLRKREHKKSSYSYKKYAGYLVKVYVGFYNYNELLRLENEEENQVRGQAGDLKNIAARKQRIMDVGFRLFCERRIQSFP